MQPGVRHMRECFLRGLVEVLIRETSGAARSGAARSGASGSRAVAAGSGTGSGASGSRAVAAGSGIGSGEATTGGARTGVVVVEVQPN
eukprot:6149342-Prymnesium_polylepis.1